MTGFPHSSLPEPQSGIAAVLARLRGAAKAQLIVQRAGLLLAGLLAATLALGLLDYFLRFPLGVRLVLWVVGLTCLVALIRRHVVPAILFRPSLTHVALRVEESEPGKKAGLRGVLASALELSASPQHSVLSAELASMTQSEATRRFSGAFTTGALLAKKRLGQAMIALLAIGLPLTLLSVSVPGLIRIGAARVLAPWSSAAWPKRTGVVDANPLAAHATGLALPLRAIVTRTTQAEGQTNVAVEYRVVIDGKAGPRQRALLTGQNKYLRYEPVGGAPAVEGELYERLLDTSSMVPPHTPGTAAPTVQIEYHFETSDDETDTWRLTLVEPPAILAGTVDVVPPAYAAPVLAATQNGQLGLVHGTREVGAGRDERSSVGPILAGSRVTLRLTLNKELPTPDIDETFPGLENSEGLETKFGTTDWELSFVAKQSLRLPVLLTDKYKITAADDSSYRFEVTEDRSPVATVVEPAQDESILATAVLDAAGEGRDDVGLEKVTLNAQIAKPPAGSAGAPPDPQGEPSELAAAVPAADKPATNTALRAGATLDVSTLKVAQGDEVWLTAMASDIYAMGESRHAPVISSKRRLKIISESELIEQVRNELGALRESAKRLDEEQEKIATQNDTAAKNAQKAGELLPRQDAVGERLTPMADVVKRLEARTQRNRLTDKSLEGMLNDAGSLIKDAGEQSDKASTALNKLAGKAASDNRAQDAKDLSQAEKTVQEDLTQLANMLDRGQDNWAVKHAIEKLLIEQKQLTSQTAATGANTQGQNPENLTQGQKDELDRLAKHQQEAAQRAAALIDALQQRSGQMQQADPGQAQAMQNAANKARQQQLEDKQRQASEQIQKNQTGQAQDLQQDAEKTLQAMLDEIDKGEQQRDNALRRQLADLLESLNKLIAQQEKEIGKLGAVLAGGPADRTLDTGMVSLNQNTLSVLTAVRKVREAAEVANFVDSATNAQSAAIVSLRTSDQPEADSNEHISLKRLKDAKAAAEKLDQDAADRDEQRKKDELKKAYREALELEVALKADTTPLLGKELDRRQHATARTLGERQDAIRQAMSELRSKTQEMDEAKVFDYAHTRLDQAAAAVSGPLKEGTAPTSVGRDESSIIRILQGLLDAVNDQDKKKDQFREEDQAGGGGGGGGGGQQPLLPPIAELKLLRFLQQEAADRTRDAAEGKADNAELDTVGRLQRDLADQGKALLEKLNPGDKEPKQDAPNNQEPKQ
jgi:hypothetical protein